MPGFVRPGGHANAEDAHTGFGGPVGPYLSGSPLSPKDVWGLTMAWTVIVLLIALALVLQRPGGRRS
jgi:hypothetical protein